MYKALKAKYNGKTMPPWPTIRNVILFFGGMAGVANESIRYGAERPTLLLLYAAMLGLPAFLRADEGKKKDDPGDDK